MISKQLNFQKLLVRFKMMKLNIFSFPIFQFLLLSERTLLSYCTDRAYMVVALQ